MNQGAWQDHDLTTPDVFHEIQRTLDELDMIGIYKTTTAPDDNTTTTTTTAIELHDTWGCSMLRYCLNLSWTYELHGGDLYYDRLHFLPHVNTRFNEQLLDLIHEIDTAAAK